jgi:7 transmembrane receptor (rhodopsin family)
MTDKYAFDQMTNTEIAVGSIMLSIMVLIMASQALMLIAWLDGRKVGASANDQEDFAIFVIIADLLVGLGTFPGNLTVLLNGGFQGYGHPLCDFNATEVYFTHTFSVMCVMLYAIGTYQRFVNGTKALFWKGLLGAGLLALALLILPIIPFFAGDHYHQSPGKWYCMVDWSQKDPVWLLIILVTIGILSGSMIVTAFCYIAIYRKITRFVAEGKRAVSVKVARNGGILVRVPPKSKSKQKTNDLLIRYCYLNQGSKKIISNTRRILGLLGPLLRYDLLRTRQ